MPEYHVEYPLLCYDGPFPDSRELTISNLADLQGAKSRIKLQNLKLIKFVEHRYWTDKTKICFLAYDYSQFPDDEVTHQISHCVISCDKMFQKKKDLDMTYMDVDITPLGPASESAQFQKKLPTLIKIDSVHELDPSDELVNDRIQCFVIQYETGIYLYKSSGTDSSDWYEISTKGRMK